MFDLRLDPISGLLTHVDCRNRCYVRESSSQSLVFLGLGLVFLAGLNISQNCFSLILLLRAKLPLDFEVLLFLINVIITRYQPLSTVCALLYGVPRTTISHLTNVLFYNSNGELLT